MRISKLFVKMSAKKSVFLGAFICLFASCTHQQETAFGTYTAVEKNALQRLWGQVNGKMYPYGTSVSLHADSTFTQDNCGNVVKGTWRLKNDSLIFTATSNQWQTDSIAKIMGRPPRLGKEPFKVHFKGKKMTWPGSIIMNGKKYQSVIELEKVVEK